MSQNKHKESRSIGMHWKVKEKKEKKLQKVKLPIKLPITSIFKASSAQSLQQNCPRSWFAFFFTLAVAHEPFWLTSTCSSWANSWTGLDFLIFNCTIYLPLTTFQRAKIWLKYRTKQEFSTELKSLRITVEDLKWEILASGVLPLHKHFHFYSENLLTSAEVFITLLR